jgi:transcriptional regulator with XRE-family HTH domain
MRHILEKIRETIHSQGLSEAKLAKMVGMNQKTLNNLLAGRTKRFDPEKIKNIQAALGIDSGDTPVTPITGTSHERVSFGERSGQAAIDPIRQAIERELDRMTRKQLAEALAYLVSKNEEV